MAAEVPDGRFLKQLVWSVVVLAGAVGAALSDQAWGDSRYAPSDDHVTRTEFKLTDYRVQRLEEDLKEIKADAKEILRRLPK